MGKKLFSLCMALALCLGLLPVTALAAAPPVDQVLYVGGVLISRTGYWTTDGKGSVTAYTGESTPTDNYIHYDADNNTLTLHNASIKTALEYGNNPPNSLISGAAIGVLNQNGDANLTITLEGTNTIAEVGNGICVLAHNKSTGNASLTIRGDGNLTASGSVNSEILVQSNGGNATLSIENAEVTTTSNSSDGVLVQAQEGSNASLTVNGGSLTATGSGTYGAGIRFLFGSSDSSSRTPSLTVSGNAMVKASGGEGGISDNSNTDIHIGVGDNSSGGIVFDGNEGTVYGSVELQENLTIGEGESLTIPEGSSLTVPEDKTITVESGGKLEGTPIGNGTVKIAPTITTTTESLPEGTVGEPYTETILAATGDALITWSVNNGSLPAGLSLSKDGKITGTPTSAGTSTFTVKAENSYGSDSKKLSITINEPATISVTGVSLDQSALTLTEDGTETLTATITPDNATNKNVTWKSDNANVATVQNGTVNAVGAGEATITVTTEDGNKTATCAVTVEKPYTPPPYIPPTKTPSEQAIDKIEDAKEGSTVKITLRTGQTKLDKEVFEELAGRDVTL